MPLDSFDASYFLLNYYSTSPRIKYGAGSSLSPQGRGILH
jgi:hypothetical protein